MTAAVSDCIRTTDLPDSFPACLADPDNGLELRPVELPGGARVFEFDASQPPRDTFTRTIEPWDPEIVPSTPPSVDLTAACVRHVRGGQFEAVFSYDNPEPTSQLVPLDPDRRSAHPLGGNVILRENLRSRPSSRTVQVEDVGPQVTLLKPGRHPYAFAVRFEPYERVAWQAEIRAQEGNHWKVTVRPRMGVRCAHEVPDHFAVLQNVELRAPIAPLV